MTTSLNIRAWIGSSLLLAGLAGAAAAEPAETGVEKEVTLSNAARAAVPEGNNVYGLLVGINYAADPLLPELASCEGDAAALEVALNETEGVLYSDATLVRLGGGTQKIARTDVILSQLGQMCELADSEDTLLFYFSGHGVQNGNENYLVPAGEYDPSTVPYSWLPLSQVLNRMQPSRAKYKIVILDACHSGPLNTAALEGWVNRGYYILTSCDVDETSREIPGIGGLFTYFLRDGLGGKADLNRDSCVDLQEVQMFARDQLKSWFGTNLPDERGMTPVLFGRFAEPVPLAVVDSAGPLLVQSSLLASGGQARSKEVSLDQFNADQGEEQELVRAKNRLYLPARESQLTRLPVDPGSLALGNFAGGAAGVDEHQDRSEVNSRIRPEELQQALQELEAYTATHAQNPTGWRYLGMALYLDALLTNSDPTPALEAQQAAVRLDPDYAAAWVELAYTLAWVQQYGDAAQALDQAAAAAPLYAPVLLARSSVAFQQDELAAAILAARHAIELDENYAAAWSSLGALLTDGEDYAGAAAALKRAVELDPESPDTYYNLGMLYWRQRLTAAAEENFRQAVQLHERFADGWLGLGLSITVSDPSIGGSGPPLLTSGRFAEAEQALLKCEELEPWSAAPQLGLGMLYLVGVPRTAEAQQRLERVLQLAPGGVEALSAQLGLGFLQLQLSDWAAAEASALGALALVPTLISDPDTQNSFRVIIYPLLGQVYRGQLRWPEAEEAYRQALAIVPGNVSNILGLGDLFYDQARYIDAEQTYLYALSVDPNSATAYYNLAYTYGAQNNFAQAAAAARRYLELTPGDPYGDHAAFLQWIAQLEAAAVSGA